ncbi:MAG: hypothetical protein KKB21_03395 [Nanoarchaeota archaeon]|nr:hypothetical protein [Nanoarchaeota archaeon]MBU4086594.1 hypothetical protein [Nanoarchaeota archaeon]
MLPETDFHRRRNLIFAIIDGRYYNASNSMPVVCNYLTLCDLRFPLSSGRKIDEEEAGYSKKHKELLLKRKSEFEKEFNSGRGTSELEKELEILEDTAFFLEYLCKQHNFHLKVEEPQSYIQITDSLINESPIFPEIIKGNHVVINRRVYPLEEIAQPVFINLNGKNYTILPSKMKVEDIERRFHEVLESRLRFQAMKDSEKVNELNWKTSILKEKIKIFIRDIKVSVYPHCYECGELGFDTSARCIYWLISPHHNETTGRRYSEGQCAAALHFSRKNLSTSAVLAERANRNSAFIINSTSPCMGFSFVGNTTEDKMFYLRKWATNVETNKQIRVRQENNEQY